MKKLSYYITRLFFSKEKLLLIRLLNEIKDSLYRYPDGSVKMKYGGMCAYVGTNTVTYTIKDFKLLSTLLYDNIPEITYNETYFFTPYLYEPRYEFLKELIKKY